MLSIFIPFDLGVTRSKTQIVLEELVLLLIRRVNDDEPMMVGGVRRIGRRIMMRKRNPKLSKPT